MTRLRLRSSVWSGFDVDVVFSSGCGLGLGKRDPEESRQEVVAEEGEKSVGESATTRRGPFGTSIVGRKHVQYGRTKLRITINEYEGRKDILYRIP